jgi:hypothetical protein
MLSSVAKALIKLLGSRNSSVQTYVRRVQLQWFLMEPWLLQSLVFIALNCVKVTWDNYTNIVLFRIVQTSQDHLTAVCTPLDFQISTGLNRFKGVTGISVIDQATTGTTRLKQSKDSPIQGPLRRLSAPRSRRGSQRSSPDCRKGGIVQEHTRYLQVCIGSLKVLHVFEHTLTSWGQWAYGLSLKNDISGIPPRAAFRQAVFYPASVMHCQDFQPARTRGFWPCISSSCWWFIARVSEHPIYTIYYAHFPWSRL